MKKVLSISIVLSILILILAVPFSASADVSPESIYITAGSSTYFLVGSQSADFVFNALTYDDLYEEINGIVFVGDVAGSFGYAYPHPVSCTITSEFIQQESGLGYSVLRVIAPGLNFTIDPRDYTSPFSSIAFCFAVSRSSIDGSAHAERRVLLRNYGIDYLTYCPSYLVNDGEVTYASPFRISSYDIIENSGSYYLNFHVSYTDGIAILLNRQGNTDCSCYIFVETQSGDYVADFTIAPASHFDPSYSYFANIDNYLDDNYYITIVNNVYGSLSPANPDYYTSYQTVIDTFIDNGALPPTPPIQGDDTFTVDFVGYDTYNGNAVAHYVVNLVNPLHDIYHLIVTVSSAPTDFIYNAFYAEQLVDYDVYVGGQAFYDAYSANVVFQLNPYISDLLPTDIRRVNFFNVVNPALFNPSDDSVLAFAPLVMSIYESAFFAEFAVIFVSTILPLGCLIYIVRRL